jgi:hypothetical protein
LAGDVAGSLVRVIDLEAIMNPMRRAVLVVVVFLAVGAKVAMAGETQIVLQWLDTALGGIDLQQIHKLEDALEAASSGQYVVDGHDVGGGVVNVFLYAEDSRVDSAIAVVIRFFERGSLPKGMRIGRAIYEDEQRKNWHFQPVYPPGLAHFDIDIAPPRSAPPK